MSGDGTRQSVTTRDGVVFTVDTTGITLGLLRAEVAALRLEVAQLRATPTEVDRKLRVIAAAAETLPCTCRHDHDGPTGLPCARCQIVTEARGA